MFTFWENKNKIDVKNVTQFNVKLFGVEVFSIFSNSLEVYENDKLILFESKTSQNRKEKYDILTIYFLHPTLGHTPSSHVLIDAFFSRVALSLMHVGMRLSIASLPLLKCWEDI